MYNACGSTCQPRSFLTKSEKIEMLKEYKKDLENEVLGISERIAELSESD
jgi:hypothetical protein